MKLDAQIVNINGDSPRLNFRFVKDSFDECEWFDVEEEKTMWKSLDPNNND